MYGDVAQPISAVITIPFAFVGPWAWEIAWLVYPIAAFIWKRARRAKQK